MNFTEEANDDESLQRECIRRETVSSQEELRED
jgi:hypothetical protein